MNEDEENLILLYWSGELAGDEVAKAQQLLKSSAPAREFLTDLEFQSGLSRSSRINLPKGKIATAAANIVADEMASSKVVPFPGVSKRRHILAIGGAVAAAIAVLVMIDWPSPPHPSGPVVESSSLRPGKMSDLTHQINELETQISDAHKRTRFRGPSA